MVQLKPRTRAQAFVIPSAGRIELFNILLVQAELTIGNTTSWGSSNATFNYDRIKCPKDTRMV